MARRHAALAALVLLTPALARAQADDASEEAKKVAAALAKLNRFTVDVGGVIPAPGGMLGGLGGGSGQRLEATFAVDASENARQPRWRATATVALPMGGKNIQTVAVQQGGELFVSAKLPMPGGQGHTMAYRMPAPAGTAGVAAAPAQLGPSSAGQFTSWLEGQLDRAAPGKVRRTGRTLHLTIADPSQGREEPLALSYGGNYLPTRVVIGNPQAPRADIRFNNFRTPKVVDTSLPLPREQYQPLNASMLGGLGGMMGGGSAAATSPAAPARSPFVRPSGAGTGTGGGASALPSIPIPGLSGLGGAAPTGQQSQALQGIVSTLTKQLGAAMAGPPPGKQASGIPGLNLSPGTMNLLKHMQKLREGQATGGSGGGGANPAAGMQALTGMLERLGSGARPGASVNPDSLNKASDTIQQLLQRLRTGQGGAGGLTGGATSGGAATQAAPAPLKNPPRRGMSGGRATSAEALERMQELMKKLERTAPVQGK